MISDPLDRPLAPGPLRLVLLRLFEPLPSGATSSRQPPSCRRVSVPVEYAGRRPRGRRRPAAGPSTTSTTRPSGPRMTRSRSSHAGSETGRRIRSRLPAGPSHAEVRVAVGDPRGPRATSMSTIASPGRALEHGERTTVLGRLEADLAAASADRMRSIRKSRGPTAWWQWPGRTRRRRARTRATGRSSARPIRRGRTSSSRSRPACAPRRPPAPSAGPRLRLAQRDRHILTRRDTEHARHLRQRPRQRPRRVGSLDRERGLGADDDRQSASGAVSRSGRRNQSAMRMLTRSPCDVGLDHHVGRERARRRTATATRCRRSARRGRSRTGRRSPRRDGSAR